MKKKGNRLDIELVKREFFSSREKAKAYIMSGEVFVNGFPVIKPDKSVLENDKIEIKEKNVYASRGAYKIEKAFNDFNFNLFNKRAVDIGISNGGFTDYILRQGAKDVLGIDVNIKQLDYKLANDKRVKVLKLNARFLTKKHIDFKPDLIVIDVSFISILKILEPLRFLEGVPIVSLVKPQFEAGRREVTKGGVISSVEKSAEIVIGLKKKLESIGYSILNFTKAGIKGKKGNQEYFFLLEYGNKQSISDKIIEDEIKI